MEEGHTHLGRHRRVKVLGSIMKENDEEYPLKTSKSSFCFLFPDNP